MIRNINKEYGLTIIAAFLSAMAYIEMSVFLILISWSPFFIQYLKVQLLKVH